MKNDEMKAKIKSHISLGNIVEILIIIASVIWIFAFLRSDVDKNTEWNTRQDAQHKEFMRRDVGDAQFKAIRDQLDRIEKKID